MVKPMEVSVSCTDAGGCVAPCQSTPSACTLFCGAACGTGCGGSCGTTGGAMAAAGVGTTAAIGMTGGTSTSSGANSVGNAGGIDMVTESAAINFWYWWYS